MTIKKENKKKPRGFSMIHIDYNRKSRPYYI